MIKNDVISTQRDNICNSKCLMAYQKSMLHLRISILGCFFVKTVVQ